jgi:hypothetical protein
VNEYDALGRPLASLDGSSPAVREIEKLAERLIEQP